jgi:hypothetical protein
MSATENSSAKYSRPPETLLERAERDERGLQLL